MFPRRIDVALLAVTLLLASFAASAFAQQAADEMSLSELQAERIEVLSQAVEQARTLYQNSTVPYHEVWEAQRTLYEAQLEQSNSKEERVAILEKYVEAAKLDEEIAVQLLEVARGSSRDVSRAKAERLRIEIMLKEIKSQKEVAANADLRRQEILAVHHLQIQEFELTKAEANLRIAKLRSEVTKLHVGEMRLRHDLKEVQLKHAEKLAQQAVQSDLETANYQLEADVAKASLRKAEANSIESEIQIAHEQANVDIAKVEVEVAKEQLESIRKRLADGN